MVFMGGRIHGASVPKGLIYAINPALIICLVPVITAYTSNVSSIVIIEVGSYVSALRYESSDNTSCRAFD